MEGYHHSSSAWLQGPSPTDCRPPGAVEGAIPDAWAATQSAEPYALASAAFKESSAFPPVPSSVDLLGPDTLTGQERKENQSRVRKPKTRTTFSQEQLRLLRSHFAASRYITREKGCQLAKMLGLNYKQVKTWFQNQRLKVKRLQTVPVCTTDAQDPSLSQLEPATGPQGFSLSPSFHMDPVNNCPENNSGWSNQVLEDQLQNYGEVSSPYQMTLQPGYPASTLEAPVGHTGWDYPVGSQSSLASCAPGTMQGYPSPFNTSVQGSRVQLELSSSDGSEVSSASAPSPNGSGALWDQFYPPMGKVLSAP